MSTGTALVTGVTGCIGAAVAARLRADGWRVRGLVREAGAAGARVDEEHVGDLARGATLAGACDGADLVVHAGAHVADWGPRELYWQVNRDGTAALLEDALACGVGRFVYVSTADVFGFRRGIVVEERSPKLCPRHPYSRSKQAGETLVWVAARRGLGVNVVYLPWVFGPGDRHFTPEIVEGLESGRLLHFDRGTPRLDLTYSENLAGALALIAGEESARGEAYIVADGYDVTLGIFIEEVARLAGLAPPRGSIPRLATHLAAAGSELYAAVRGSSKRPLMTRYATRCVTAGVHLRTDKIRALGYRPAIGFAEGLRRTLAAAEAGAAPAPAAARATAEVGAP